MRIIHQNAGGSASDSGTENSMGTSSEYRYSGPFYQDNISSDSSSEGAGSNSSSVTATAMTAEATGIPESAAQKEK